MQTPQKRTKIIATVWPATSDEEKLIALYENGANIIRFNFSHADHAGSKMITDRIHALNTSGKTNLSLLLDTKWPELRTGDVGTKISYKKGDVFTIHTVQENIQNNDLFCDYPYLAEDVTVGQIIEIDSGLFHTKVTSVQENSVEVEALNDAVIGSRRHINLPGVKIRLPGITEKDKEDILFAIENKYAFIAASFIRTADNIHEIRSFLEENGGSHIKIIAKIENAEGVENLESIIAVTDGVMVARGDLGIEVPIETVPRYQKNIIDLARQYGKFVIVATHMLESMIECPFPTRAEVSDIFRAVLQGTDTTMLSGETAMGKYPIEAISMMQKVILEAEEEIERTHHEFDESGLTERDREKKYIIKSALMIAESLNIEHIILFTKTGRLARLAAAYRPNQPIFSITGNQETHEYVNILFSVKSVLLPDWNPNDHTKNIDRSLQMLREKNLIQTGDRAVIITDIHTADKEEIPTLEIIKIGQYTSPFFKKYSEELSI